MSAELLGERSRRPMSTSSTRCVRPARRDAGHRTLLMAGHPMEAGGFAVLAEHIADRVVVTYDPRAPAAASARTTATSARRSCMPPTCTP